MTREYGNATAVDSSSSPQPSRKRASPRTVGYEDEPRIVSSESAQSVLARVESNGTVTAVGKQRTILPTLDGKDNSKTVRVRVGDQPRYEAVKQLGEGAMGTVSLARDHDIARLVAVKRLKSDTASLAPVARFVEEIRTVGQLEHPNIVSIHDVGADDDGYFFVMRYLEGETLEDVIEKLALGSAEYQARYTFEYRVQIFLKVLDAVNYAHVRGMLHRDIKPSNIIIGKHGEVTLADWGIAKPIGGTETPANAADESPRVVSAEKSGRLARTDPNGCVGTPAYMSPEQVQGEPLDVRSDIYGLCATFYEFLTTRYYLHPKVSVDAEITELFATVPFVEPVVPDTIEDPVHGHVPRELSFFVMRGLSKDREKRFASVAEMIDELQADLQGRTCVYCTSTMVKRGVNEYARFLDDHRVLGVIVLGLVSLFAIFGIVQAVAVLFAHR